MKHDQKMAYFKNVQKHIKDKTAKIKDLQKKNADTSVLQRELQELKSGITESEYLLNAFPILLRHQELEQITDPTPEQKKEKLDLVFDYFIKTNDQRSLDELKTELYINLQLKHPCIYCKAEMQVDDDGYMCQACDYNVKDTNFQINKDDFERVTIKSKQYGYAKETYLESYLKRLEAQENKTIPQHVIDKVLLQLNKENYTQLHLIDEPLVKKMLKKTGNQTYYENVISIINKINNRPNPQLTPEIKQQVRSMFKKCQEPYKKYKPDNRKSYFSYPYLLYQIFKLLGLDEYCKYYPLLKSEEKLRTQDQIFKKVVEELRETDNSFDWKFYPTI